MQFGLIRVICRLRNRHHRHCRRRHHRRRHDKNSHCSSMIYRANRRLSNFDIFSRTFFDGFCKNHYRAIIPIKKKTLFDLASEKKATIFRYLIF